MLRNPKWMTVVGWILTVLIAALLTMSAGMKLSPPPDMVEQWRDKLGYPLTLLKPIAATELTCAVLYLIPQTAVLGAVLSTGYLGGATATHARIEDPMFVSPVIVGMCVWLGLFLTAIRALLPWRRPWTSSPPTP